MILYLGLLASAVGRIHQYHTELIILCIVKYITEQRIIMIYLRHINIMQKHICNAEHIWELFLFNSVN